MMQRLKVYLGNDAMCMTMGKGILRVKVLDALQIELSSIYSACINCFHTTYSASTMSEKSLDSHGPKCDTAKANRVWLAS